MSPYDDLKLTWVQLSRRTQSLIIEFMSWILFSKMDTPTRVLIFRTGSIGDNIAAIPAISAIRNHYRNAEIILLTDAGAQNMAGLTKLMASSMFDSVIDSQQPPGNLRKVLRQKNIDLVIELPQNIITLWIELRNMLFFRLAGIKSGFGWKVTTIYAFEQTQEKHLKFESETENLLGILRANGVAVKPSYDYPLQLLPHDNEVVSRAVASKQPTGNGSWVALVPGAKRQMNRYPFERFVDLTKWLTEKGYAVFVVGGKEDVERGNTLAKLDRVYSFCGELTPIQSAILLSKCRLTISNDTGPMHLSYAVGTPVIGLFSSRDFQEKWFPPKPSIALRNYDVHCSLCFSETCANNICMQGIPLEAVKNAFLELEAQLK